MSSHDCTSEDGECSSSPKKPEEIVELLDNGSFILDFNDDAADIVLNTSTEETNGNTGTKGWKDAILVNVMTANDDVPKAHEKKKNDNRRKPACFNCGGDHTLTQCPEPKDFQKIKASRDAFNEEKNNKDVRYSSKEDEPFKAGRLSENLQRALGLGPNDIPEYIYRMRKMGFVKGYPPGYLKIAMVKQSSPDDVLTFHSDAFDLKDDKKEESEQKRPSSPTLNRDKIIYYFGFNKSYRALRDREKFVVPPFDAFCDFLTEEVKKNFWEEKKREERKRKHKEEETEDTVEKKARPEEEENDDVVVVDKDGSPLIKEEESIEENIVEEESNNSSLVSTPQSRRVSMGTPVSRMSRTNSLKKVPSLDAFAVGIVPFHVEEPTPRTGFLQKMMKKIKDRLG